MQTDGTAIGGVVVAPLVLGNMGMPTMGLMIGSNNIEMP